MSKLEKDLKDKCINPAICPICGVATNYVHRMEDGKTKEKSDWYKCQCGVIFQSELPAHDIYNERYIYNLAEAKQSKERYGYLARIYVPLIEELIFGRMMLEVGFCTPHLLQIMKERGWLTWGIDVNPTLTGKGDIYKGDFISYDFSLPVKDEEMKKLLKKDKIDRKFDLIWMGHTLEHFDNPIQALDKAYNLLDEKGVLFISTPDIDFINKTGVSGFPHFKKREHYIMWSERALKRELERLGFKIIMCRRNFSSKFMSWYDLHIIAQKMYF